ncbi:MAG: TetR/AcrR family transcriptional regulator [Paracoccus sp. (in: a-proteobacteria)]
MPHRQSYHHGNLREALVEAALALIEQTGPESFSLSEAARRAGVSPAAPYRHFKGRDDLLEEVARRGFIEFSDAISHAYDDGRPTPLSGLSRIGYSYLEFARERPGYYMAMFESGIPLTANPELWDAAENALGVLIRATDALAERLPEKDRPPARMMANHIWAMSHGVVELFARNKQGARSPISAEDMLRSGVLIYLRGLKLIGD